MFGLVLFLHMLAVTGFVGIVIASMFFVRSALNHSDNLMAVRAIKITLIGDVLMLPCIITLFGTGLYLVCLKQLSIQVPWILVALVTFSLVSLLWVVSAFLKVYFYRVLKNNKKVGQSFWWLYLLVSLVMIFLFIVMMRDAITQSTVFFF